MRYFFLLGNATELAKAELERVTCQKAKLTAVGIAEIEQTFDLEEAKKRLGGTVKIFEEIASISKSSYEEEIASQVVTKLLEAGSEVKAPDFAFSFIGNVPKNSQTIIRTLSKAVKSVLEEKGLKSRFVLPISPKTEISSVVVSKQKLFEINVIFADNGEIYLSKTIWVQDFASWGKYDYGRPESESHIGMLPPKVARMMLNLAIGNEDIQGKTILDPFCGVGTILSEGLQIGFESVIGSDIDNSQLIRAEKNLSWLVSEKKMKSKFSLQRKSSLEISQALKQKSINYIVTEPDMGPNNENYLRSNLKTITLRLNKLYEESFADWKKILKENGLIVIAIPTFYMFGREHTDCLSNIIDKAKVMGYSLEVEPFSYFRPQAIVRRNICIFRFLGY